MLGSRERGDPIFFRGRVKPPACVFWRPRELAPLSTRENVLEPCSCDVMICMLKATWGCDLTGLHGYHCPEMQIRSVFSSNIQTALTCRDLMLVNRRFAK